MRFRRTIASVVAVAGTMLCSLSAQAQLTQVEYQYIYAIRKNDIAKARTLRKMANIDPNRMSGGRTLIGSVPEFPGSFLHLKPAAYDYVVKELKQDLNTPLPGYDGSIFATFCFTLSVHDELHAGRQEEFWQQSIKRINEALDHGARATPLANIPPHAEPGQPLPMCVKAYLAVRHIPARAEDMLNIIQRLIKAGANPNTPAFGVLLLARAVEKLDVPLLEALVEHGANINATYPALPEGVCSLPKRVTNTVLAYVPDPDDRALEPARRFLVAIMMRGGRLDAPRHSSRYSAGDCITTAKTLKQRALDRGQVRYAQMVEALEESQSNLPPSFVNSVKSAPVASAGGPIRVTASLNTRQNPSTSAPIARKLNPGDTLALAGTPRDGWSPATLADGTRVFVNLAALAANTTASEAIGSTTPSLSPKDADEAHKEAVRYLIHGATAPGKVIIVDTLHHSNNMPAWERRTTFTHTFEGDCHLRVVTEYTERSYDPINKAWGQWEAGAAAVATRHSGSTLRREYAFDFNKASQIEIKRIEDAEEALLRSLSSRPGPRFPRVLTQIVFVGQGGLCSLDKRSDGSSIPCDKATAYWRQTAQREVTPKRLREAFARVKSRCTNGRP